MGGGGGKGKGRGLNEKFTWKHACFCAFMFRIYMKAQKAERQWTYSQTIRNSLKKQKSLYKESTTSIKTPYKFIWELMTHKCVIGW